MKSLDDLERAKMRSVIAELGMVIRRDGNELVTTLSISDGMKIPGTDILRLSVVAIWADSVLGMLAISDLAPRVPATVELDVQLVKPITARGTIISRACAVKIGKTICEFAIDFRDESGTALGYGHGLFMATPNPEFTLPPGDWAVKGFTHPMPGLTQPITERIQCARAEPGVASLQWSRDTQNATRAINGGIMTVAIEEAVLSAAAPGQSLSSMMVTYQRSIRTGPAIARATVEGCLGRVEVIDAEKNALAVLATTQLFPT